MKFIVTNGSIMETTTSYDSGILIIAEWMCYGSADEKYREYVRIAERTDWTRPESLAHTIVSDTISKLESAIFGIEAADVPALLWAYRRYENLIGEDEFFFGEFTEQERIDYLAFYRGELEWSFDLAVGFMIAACGLSLPKCMGWVSKMMAARERCGDYDNNQ